MQKLDKLGKNIGKLIEKINSLQKERNGLEEKIKRIEKDLSFHIDRNQEIPEVALKNKKLINERKKVAEQIDNIIKGLDEI